MARVSRLLFVALALAVLPQGIAAAQMTSPDPERIDGHATAISGDRIRINGAELALYGIDAPELEQTCWTARHREYDCGATAREMLTRLLGSDPITCWSYGAGSDTEEVGRCFRGTADLGGIMVMRGWARAQRGLSHRYDAAEARAQMDRAGMWSGSSEAPWVWRARNGQ